LRWSGQDGAARLREIGQRREKLVGKPRQHRRIGHASGKILPA
jgi:hypothetical protein